MKLKAVDYLGWLKDKEDLDMWEIELSLESRDTMRVEQLEEDLATIRDIKDIVAAWGNQDE